MTQACGGMGRSTTIKGFTRRAGLFCYDSNFPCQTQVLISLSHSCEGRKGGCGVVTKTKRKQIFMSIQHTSESPGELEEMQTG
jgi:hypothetical protein